MVLSSLLPWRRGRDSSSSVGSPPSRTSNSNLQRSSSPTTSASSILGTPSAGRAVLQQLSPSLPRRAPSSILGRKPKSNTNTNPDATKPPKSSSSGTAAGETTPTLTHPSLLGTPRRHFSFSRPTAASLKSDSRDARHPSASSSKLYPPTDSLRQPTTALMTSWDAPSPYGYTPKYLDIQLTCAQVSDLIEVAAQAIVLRGLKTPLLFSTLSLGLTSQGPNSLIRTYLGASGRPPGPHARITPSFASEAQFAEPADLAAVIKWALGRIYTSIPVPDSPEPDTRVRGVLSLDTYLAWRHNEAADGYPPTAYLDLYSCLAPDTAQLVNQLLSLLSSTAAHAIANGMTPARLARHFGPLLFGLPEDETFARTYHSFVRVTNATEHVLLAYIRYLGTTLSAKGTSLPTRLLQATVGYPSSLSPNLDVLQPQTGKVVPLTILERSVKSYAHNLLSHALTLDLPTKCKEWDACHLHDPRDAARHGLLPQFSPTFSKSINYHGGIQMSPPLSNEPPLMSRGSSTPTPEVPSAPFLQTRSATSPDPHAATHASLADKQWTDFVRGGFGDNDGSKLAFDLHEGARKQWATHAPAAGEKHWREFAASGFDPTEGETLSAALAFTDVTSSTPEVDPVQAKAWEKEMARKKKLAMAEPPFPYDRKARVMASPTMSSVARTTARGDSSASQCPSSSTSSLVPTSTLRPAPPEAKMDEVFAEVWADYLWCGGWSRWSPATASAVSSTEDEDSALRAVLNRRRASNWVLVQYKSRPTRWTVNASEDPSPSPTPRTPTPRPDDPRTDAAYFIVSEVVPAAYRNAIEAHEARQAAGKWGKVHRVFKRKPARTFDIPIGTPATDTGSITSSRKFGWATGSAASSVFGRKKDEAEFLDDDPDDPFRPGMGTTRLLTLASSSQDDPLHDDQVEELSAPVDGPSESKSYGSFNLSRSGSRMNRLLNGNGSTHSVPISPQPVKDNLAPHLGVDGSARRPRRPSIRQRFGKKTTTAGTQPATTAPTTYITTPATPATSTTVCATPAPAPQASPAYALEDNTPVLTQSTSCSASGTLSSPATPPGPGTYEPLFESRTRTGSNKDVLPLRSRAPSSIIPIPTQSQSQLPLRNLQDLTPKSMARVMAHPHSALTSQTSIISPRYTTPHDSDTSSETNWLDAH